MRAQRGHRRGRHRQGEETAVFEPPQAHDARRNEQQGGADRPDERHPELDGVTQRRVNKAQVPDRIQDNRTGNAYSALEAR